MQNKKQTKHIHKKLTEETQITTAHMRNDATSYDSSEKCKLKQQ